MSADIHTCIAPATGLQPHKCLLQLSTTQVVVAVTPQVLASIRHDSLSPSQVMYLLGPAMSVQITCIAHDCKRQLRALAQLQNRHLGTYIDSSWLATIGMPFVTALQVDSRLSDLAYSQRCNFAAQQWQI